MTMPERILIVDDHILFREGLVGLLKNQPDFDVVGEAGTVSDACNKALDLQPNIILMDFSLPDGTGAEAAEKILATHPEINIVFLTVHETDDMLFASIRSGAKGYLLKNLPVSKLLEALRGLSRGEAPLSRQMTSRILDKFAHENTSGYGIHPVLHQLTPREIEIIKEVSSGATNDEIALHLFISVNTVKNHIHNILEKLDLKNRRDLAAFAQKYRL
jgi:DNA-binding NarL/FixJ family response regulator